VRVEIRYLKFVSHVNRPVAVGQLWSVEQNTAGGNQELIMDDRVAILLSIIKERNYVLVNSQEILDLIVRVNGFAA